MNKSEITTKPLDEKVYSDKIKIEEIETITPENAIIAPEEVIIPRTETVGIKNIKIYLDSDMKFDFDMLRYYRFDINYGDYLTLLRFQTYLGKPSRWEAEEMYQYQCFGWNLISSKK